MAYKIEYKTSVESDLKRLDKSIARPVLTKLEFVLRSNPNAGERLAGEFEGLFKYRVGDYRVVYAKTPDGILVMRIRHRKKAYR